MPSDHARPNRPDLPWRDLVPLSAPERIWELTLSLPWLLLSLVAYATADQLFRTQPHHWPLGGGNSRLTINLSPPALGALAFAMLCSFFFFLTGLRQSHNAQHSCLGIGRFGHHLMLLALSILMLSSMHAVRVTHLHHHRHCLHDEDEEARHAAWPWWKVLLMGPVLIIRLHSGAWRIAKPREREWIVLELALILLTIIAAIALPIPALKWHAAAMLSGECLTAFFAVWIVHRGCDPHHQIARTQRGWIKNLVSYSMFYHLEHHLFPAVPTCHLPKLAQRLDAADPRYREKQVI